MSFRKNKYGGKEEQCLTLTTTQSNLSIRIGAGVTSPTNDTTPTTTLSCNQVTLVAIWSSSIALTVKAVVCVRGLKVVLLQKMLYNLIGRDVRCSLGLCAGQNTKQSCTWSIQFQRVSATNFSSTTLPANTGNHLPTDRVSQTRRLVFSTTPLWQPQIYMKKVSCCASLKWGLSPINLHITVMTNTLCMEALCKYIK